MGAKWLEWAKEIDAIAQAGLTYTEGPFDRERYKMLRRLSADIVANHTSVDENEVLDILNAQSGYTTPKVDVRGAVFQDGRVLLVREVTDGQWSLPGGWVDPGQRPGQAVVKEIWEETGYEAKPGKLAAVLDRDSQGHTPFMWAVYKLHFVCELTGGEAKHSVETDGVEFFCLDDLPELSLARITREQIDQLYRHHLDPDLPTEYD